MKTPRNSYNYLEKYINSLIAKYITPHVTSLNKPSIYDNDVRAFCVLTHAAFEGYLEELALYAMDWSFKRYTNTGKITRPLLMLVLCYGDRNDVKKHISNFDNWSTMKASDVLRNSINDVMKAHSNKIKNNNGFSLKYCSDILLPVAINAPNNGKLTSAVDSLKDYRGLYAHTHRNYGKIIKSTSPNDVKDVVTDCLKFCENIRDSALQVCR